MKTDTKILSDYLRQAHQNQQSLISLADGKANIVLALIGVILSLFFNFVITKNIVQTKYIFIILTPLLIAGFFAFITLYPRKSFTKEKESLLYFAEAKKINIKEKTKSLLQKAEVQIIEDYLTNIKAIGKIVDKKFRNLRISYIFLAIGILIKLVFETTI